MPSLIQETTLECISNEIGDGLMSNALWTGVPMPCFSGWRGRARG
jgi:hypothetical protein